MLNDNKEKEIKEIKAKKPKKADKTVSNPLAKQLNELRKPALKKPATIKIDTAEKTEKQKEILFMKEDIKNVKGEKTDYSRLIKYYKRKLVDYGVMKEIRKAKKQTKPLTECMQVI